MGGRSGLGLVDVAVLEALESLGARPDRPHVKSARVAAELGNSIGLGTRHAYGMLVDLASDWLLNVVLVDGHGNFGSPDDPPANERYTEARLSAAGMLALAAERGGPPVPVGLVNGDVHTDGPRPPFDPHRMVDALLRLVDHPAVADEELVAMVGPPTFPTRCDVDGDLGALVAGHAVEVQLRARIRREGPTFTLDRFPPGFGMGEVGSLLSMRAMARDWHHMRPELRDRAQLPLADMRSEGSIGDRRLVCVAKPDADLDDVEAKLRESWGVAVSRVLQLPAPLPTVLRSSVDPWPSRDEVRRSLEAFRRAV